MRVVLDTNVLVSALLSPAGPPAVVYRAWIEGRFTLLTSTAQLVELKSTVAKPKLRHYLHRVQAGELVNELRKFAEVVAKVPVVQRSRDADDDFLLGIAEGGGADYLVTGDKGHLLLLSRHGRTQIVAVSHFIDKVLHMRMRACFLKGHDERGSRT